MKDCTHIQRDILGSFDNHFFNDWPDRNERGRIKRQMIFGCDMTDVHARNSQKGSDAYEESSV